MSRTFIFSFRNCNGPVGGGQGVTYKLYLANQKNKMIKDVYYCFKDRTIDDDYVDKSDAYLISSTARNNVRKKINSNGCASILLMYMRLNKAKKWIRAINKKYVFTDEDKYIFQDFESAYAFSCLYKFKKTIMIYHQQGSLYYEWSSFGGKQSKIYRSILNKKFTACVGRLRYIGFPSQGAKESLIQTEPTYEEIINSKECHILYNGFSKTTDLPEVSERIKPIIDLIKESNMMKFSTVAALNEAKGVERIPQYLAKFKESNGEFLWVVVGNGVKAGELEQNIEKFGLENEVIWIKEPISHDDILNIFSLTDFYILFHRFSIFDFATIEAMSYGNVPVLTPVGGNKEVIEKNGVLVDNFADCNSLDTLLRQNNLESLKKLNCEMQGEKFSETAFLDRYVSLIKSM